MALLRPWNRVPGHGYFEWDLIGVPEDILSRLVIGRWSFFQEWKWTSQGEFVFAP
jgi:hypothetical protein